MLSVSPGFSISHMYVICCTVALTRSSELSLIAIGSDASARFTRVGRLESHAILMRGILRDMRWFLSVFIICDVLGSE